MLTPHPYTSELERLIRTGNQLGIMKSSLTLMTVSPTWQDAGADNVTLTDGLFYYFPTPVRFHVSWKQFFGVATAGSHRSLEENWFSK